MRPRKFPAAANHARSATAPGKLEPVRMVSETILKRMSKEERSEYLSSTYPLQRSSTTPEMRAYWSAQKRDSRIDTHPWTFRCKQCGVEYNRKDRWLRHLKDAHGAPQAAKGKQ
ncbi:hypothetical protein B0H67DRAFT_588778 [Lasiosphaeris hirsuta]|uniref:C2H2-type domain-containing protein n=1 Tax=Lasiosphaeris hirsuta TaxID=260670 RepID=A0AA40DQ18_9PEZI|nr:hypothetical protein B0H67DRAFT_588778 [Lasiosphaeris hirsuta]